MPIYRKIIGLLTLCLLLSSLPASGQSGQQSEKKEPVPSKTSSVSVSRPARVRFGGFVFGAGYSRFNSRFPYYYYYGPRSYFWPWYYDAFYPSFYGFNSPMWYHTGWYTGFAYRPGMGEVRLRSNVEDADVFLDDGFAGKAKDLKTMWLEPGAYNLRVEAANLAPYKVRIYVLSGKTLKIDAKLAPQQ